MRKIKVTENIKDLFHLQFSNQYYMNSMLVRIQEFSDSSKFRHKHFTLEEFADWWTSKEGKWNYHTDTNGLNFSGSNLRPFYMGKFDPLTEKEKRMLEMFEPQMGRLDDIYIIGTFRMSEITHEEAHGLYYLDEQYRKKVDKLLKEVPRRVKRVAYKFFREGMYHPSNFRTELNSYILDSKKDRDKDYDCKQRSQLVKLFKEYKELHLK